MLLIHDWLVADTSILWLVALSGTELDSIGSDEYNNMNAPRIDINII
jgi:hypothetical protein